MFKRNEGILDRIVRLALGLVLLPVGLFWLGGLQGSVLGLVIAGLGGFGLFSSLTGFCPLYLPFGINTLEKEKELVAKCESMRAGYRQTHGDIGTSVDQHKCGLCPLAIAKTPNQQE